MPHRGCAYEVLTMRLIFAAVIILVTTTTEAASAQIRCFPYSMMGEKAAPYAAPNAAALSPSSVLCLFPNVDMFSAMGQQQANEAAAAKQEQPRPQQEVLRSLRSQKLYRRSPSNIHVAFPQGSRLLPRLY